MATYNYSLQADAGGAAYTETTPVTAGAGGVFSYDIIPSGPSNRRPRLPSLIQLMWQHPTAAVGTVEAGKPQWHSCTLFPFDAKSNGRSIPLIETGTVWKVRAYAQGGGDGCMLAIEIN